MTDASGAVVWSATYTPFGRPVAVTGPAVNDNRFPGQRLDQLTGLSENHWRDYDPTTGRYVQSDPVGLLGGINTYAYGVNNPLGYIDSNGLNPLAVGGIVLMATLESSVITIYYVVDAYMLIRAVADIIDRLLCGKEVHTYEYFLAAIGTTYYIKWILRMSRGLRPFAMSGASSGGPWKGPHLGGGGSPLGGGGAGGGGAGVRASGGIGGNGGVKLLPAPAMHDHHIFPKEHGDWFEEKGFKDWNDYLVSVPWKTHLKAVHGKGNTQPGIPIDQYNKMWENWIKYNPDATPNDIMNFGGYLMDLHGLSGLPIKGP